MNINYLKLLDCPICLFFFVLYFIINYLFKINFLKLNKYYILYKQNIKMNIYIF